jgi:hypothetical protein
MNSYSLVLLLLKQEGLLLYLSLSTVGRHVQFLLDIEEQQIQYRCIHVFRAYFGFELWHPFA